MSERQKNARFQKFIGTYYSYALASSADHRVLETEIEVYSRFGKLRLQSSSNDGRYSYSGKLVATPSNIYLRFEGKNHFELTQYVFAMPASFRISVPIVGVASSVNPNIKMDWTTR